MCGFVGYIHGSTAWNHQTVIEGMMNRIVHRGPDSGGMYSDDKVTLGFRRLSIIDLSDNGKQSGGNVYEKGFKSNSNLCHCSTGVFLRIYID